MKGVDTNILVRYLTQDDATQSKIANKWIADIVNAQEVLSINHVVLVELIWVLSRAYMLKKDELISTLETLLYVKQFDFEDKNVVFRALDQFRLHSVDFSDALLAEKNAERGCDTTYTFDVKAAKLSRFSILR